VAVAVAGLLWRLSVALSAPWYWDEGYMAELAGALSTLSRAHVGGLWEDGFSPLSTSFLAPLSAAPFASAPWWSAMTGVRLWAVFLDCLALGALVALVRPSVHPRRALLAAACYALLPFAAEFGGRAFYHHFAVVLMLAALALGRGLFSGEKTPPVTAASLCAGLAAGTCYWLWWLPATWILLLAWKRPRGWILGLLWTALPPVALMAWNIWPDPAGAWWSIRGLMRLSGGGPSGPGATVAAFWTTFRALPFLGLGLVGLCWAAFREKGPWPWFLVCLVCAIVEPVRQRGGLSVNLPYPFMLAAPLAALGAAVLAEAALRLGSWRGGLAAAAVLALFLRPVNLTWLDTMSFAPGPVEGLKAFLQKDARPGDLVCGMPHFDWLLRPSLRVCDPFDMVASEGRSAGLYVAGAPATRFAYRCGLDDVRYAVVSRVHLLGIFRFDGVALTFLEMERAGWRLVFDNRTFKVYENPKFGVKPAPSTRILQEPDYYRRARDQAVLAGRPDLERFAEARLGL